MKFTKRFTDATKAMNFCSKYGYFTRFTIDKPSHPQAIYLKHPKAKTHDFCQLPTEYAQIIPAASGLTVHVFGRLREYHTQ